MCDHDAAQEPLSLTQRTHSRRDLLRAGLAAAAIAALPRSLRALAESPAGGLSNRPYLDAAVRAARWLQANTVRAPQGATWAANPADLKSVQSNLYSGSPGVVLFLVELHHATGDEAWLNLARAGADHLVAGLPATATPETAAGLYTGLAGVAFVLEEVAAASGHDEYRAAARKALGAIHGASRTTGAGVAWSETTDIISGSAGIGLYLLRAARTLEHPASRTLAERAGRRLLEVERRTGEAGFWMMAPSFPRNMPNFSHGTAGVAYFLATLGRETGDRAFVQAAERGARYLQGIAAETEGGGKRIFHNEPDGRELYYLSWCHGPAGTARLFHRLSEVTRDAQWSAWVPRLAHGIVASGVPQRSPGFWNNISQCCGNCGVSDFFVAMHALTGDAAHLAFARRCADDTLQRATEDGAGLKWIQAEHRVQPDNLVAQTGLMQGAAGVGLAMLRLDGALNGRKPRVVLPDSPFVV